MLYSQKIVLYFSKLCMCNVNVFRSNVCFLNNTSSKVDNFGNERSKKLHDGFPTFRVKAECYAFARSFLKCSKKGPTHFKIFF